MLPLRSINLNWEMRRTLLLFFSVATLLAGSCSEQQHIETRYIGATTPTVRLFTLDENNNNILPADTCVVRGTEVQAALNNTVRRDERTFVAITLDGDHYFADAESLFATRGEVVCEREMFVRTPASIIGDRDASQIVGLADKGATLTILGYDSLRTDGTVVRYRIQQGKTEGYVYAKYLVRDRSEALLRYKADVYDPIHSAIKNPFGGGEAIGCDFYPTERTEFADNPMPASCYALYLNISPAVLSNIESYIALAKSTKINTFVIDIKDNECPGYKAEAMRRYSPTNYAHAGANKEQMYARAVKRLHAEGFYVVGRITCFKDSYFVKDHPDAAITERATGLPFKHNKAYWPSAYDRRVWQFNVELAKEAVRKFGFNEINFDYVRFPDRMTRVESIIDYHNRYHESKVQAIQRFVMYACDEIHALGAYVSIDVFGESANPGYTTAYGQYWPALSNVADVMCGMPYPDHFSNHYYGIEKPWNHPYQILRAWGKRVQDRQAVTPTPAKVRTWIQAYNVMRHVDSNGIAYNAENVEKEIRGLFDAGLTGGYTTWLSSSNIEKYRTQAPAFSIDYYKEWCNANK